MLLLVFEFSVRQWDGAYAVTLGSAAVLGVVAVALSHSMHSYIALLLLLPVVAVPVDPGWTASTLIVCRCPAACRFHPSGRC